MTTPESSAAPRREPWWPPRLSSPLWWDDRIAGWHNLRAALARSRRGRWAPDADSSQAPRAERPLAPSPPIAPVTSILTVPVHLATGPTVAPAIEAHDAEARELRARLAALSHDHAMLRERAAGRERELAELRGRPVADDARALLAERDREIDRLRASATRITAQEGQLVAANDEIAQLRLDLADARRARESLEQRAIEHERAVAEQTALVATLRATLADLEGRGASLADRAAALTQERDLLAARIARYQESGLGHLQELQRLCAELARRSEAGTVRPIDTVARRGDPAV